MLSGLKFVFVSAREPSAADRAQLSSIFPAVQPRYHYDPYPQYLQCDKIIIDTQHLQPLRTVLTVLSSHLRTFTGKFSKVFYSLRGDFMKKHFGLNEIDKIGQLICIGMNFFFVVGIKHFD